MLNKYESSVPCPFACLRIIYTTICTQNHFFLNVCCLLVFYVLLCCSMCLFLYGLFCHGALKLDLYTLFTTFFEHLFNLYYLLSFIVVITMELFLFPSILNGRHLVSALGVHIPLRLFSDENSDGMLNRIFQ